MSNSALANANTGLTSGIRINRDIEIAAELGAVRPDLLTKDQVQLLAREVKKQMMSGHMVAQASQAYKNAAALTGAVGQNSA